MKPNILLSWLCLSTALCTFTHPSWSMKEEDNEIHIQKQKKKASFFSEEDNLKLDIIFVFPEQRGKTLTDLPPAIIGKIGDELKELKDVHTLKALCRKTRAYVEVYSSHKLVSSPKTRLQLLKQRLQNDDLKTFLRLLTHMSPPELREDAPILLMTAKTNFDYRKAENLQERQITSEAFHKQATLLKFVAIYGSEKQREEAKTLLSQHMQNLWKLVNPKQDREKNLFWLTLINQEGQIGDKIQVHQWRHANRNYEDQEQILFKKIKESASQGSLLDKLQLVTPYQKGTCGFPKDEEQAVCWMMKAGDLLLCSSFPQVEAFLKHCASFKPLHKGTASYWLEKLDQKAQEGTMEDKRNLAYLYEQLKMPHRQKVWIESLYTQVRQGELDDMRELASWYQEGHAYLPKDLEKAKYWQEEMEKIALNGSFEDKKKIAYWYAEGHYGMPYNSEKNTRKNPEKAEEWFKKVASQGAQEDKLFLAFAYSFGKLLNLVPYNLEEANHWYEEAFKDQPPRQDGLTLESSKIFLDMLLKEDPQKMQELISPVQGVGHPHAQYFWAFKCLGEKNDEEAVKWLEKAKSQGLREAAYQLGIYYKQFFKGLPEDRLRGMVSNFIAAAKRGHPLAHSELGWLHENQLGGIKDPLTSWAQAIAHYKYAALYGVKSAYERKKNLEDLLRNNIRKRF